MCRLRFRRVIFPYKVALKTMQVDKSMGSHMAISFSNMEHQSLPANDDTFKEGRVAESEQLEEHAEDHVMEGVTKRLGNRQ